MIIAAIIALLLGIWCGLSGTPMLALMNIEAVSGGLLCLLMLSVGISVGTHKEALHKIKELGLRILLVPLGVAAGSLAGGCIAACLLGHSLVQGSAIAAGMGWYSLSGVMLTELMGAGIGTTALFANILREILTFCLIPILIKYAGGYAAIAAAGATSEDTTLPALIRYGGEELVLVAVVNGVLCSALVPVLIGFLSRLYTG